MRPRFLVPGVESGATTVRLPDDEAHHLTHVLRLKAGALVSIFDGAGREWHATVATTGRSGTSVTLDASVTPVAEPAVAITLGVALQKGDRMDTIVSEATALGVAAIVPLSTAHVAVPARARVAGAIARWQRVAVASAKQCGRATVPVVHPMATLAEVLTAWQGERVLICVEPGRVGGRPEDGPGPPPARALALVGPEGGWTDAEAQQAVDVGARIVSLGPRTLRADLAPTVLLSVLGVHWRT